MKHNKGFWNDPISELSPEDQAERRRLSRLKAKKHFSELKGEALIAERAKRGEVCKRMESEEYGES